VEPAIAGCTAAIAGCTAMHLRVVYTFYANIVKKKCKIKKQKKTPPPSASCVSGHPFYV